MQRFGGISTWFLAVVLAFSPLALYAQEAPSDSLQQEFEQRYRAWRGEMASVVSPTGSPDLRPSAARDELVAMGVPSVPILIERYYEYGLPIVLASITKWHLGWEKAKTPGGDLMWICEEFPEVSYAMGESLDWRTLPRRWWEEADVLVPRLFAERYRLWKDAVAQGPPEEVAKRLKRLRDLGVWALPLMIEKVRAGDADLIASVSYLTDGALPEDATAAECLRWWEEHKADWIVPPAPKERLTSHEKEFLSHWLADTPDIETAGRVAAICLSRWLSEPEIAEVVGKPTSITADGEAQYTFAPGHRLRLEFGKSGHVVAATLELTGAAIAAPVPQGEFGEEEREALRRWYPPSSSLRRTAYVAAICLARRLTQERIEQEVGWMSSRKAPLTYVVAGGALCFRFDEQGRILSATIRQPDTPMPGPLNARAGQEQPAG
jgi:hypothetical protein